MKLRNVFFSAELRLKVIAIVMESEFFVLTIEFCKKFARDYSIVIICIEQVMAV